MNFVAKFSGRALSKEELKILRISAERQNNREARKRANRKSKPRKLHKDLHASLVETTVIILRQGYPTVFEYEGSCRHQVRSYLCVEGWGWDEADRASENVVLTALNRLGAKRPTAAEAKPEYRGEEFHGTYRRCMNPRCRSLLEEQQKLYCCDHCRRYVITTRWEENNKEKARIQRAVSQAKCKRENPQAYRIKRQRYEALRKERRPVKQCLTCKGFAKMLPRSDYCSKACHYGRNKAAKERSCVICFARFSVRYQSEKTRTCNPRCSAFLRERGPTPVPQTSNFNCEAVTPESGAA